MSENAELEDAGSEDYETQARAEGWVPEEEWQGDNKPKNFVDAETFVKRGHNIQGILKQKVEKLEAQLSSVEQTTAEFRAHTKKQLEKEAAEKAKLIKELEAKRETAITEGDGQTFTMADQELTQLRSEQPVGKTAHDELAQNWLSKNGWYTSDPVRKAFADGIAETIDAEGYMGQAYFNELTRRTQEAFPDKFKPATAAPAVEGARDSGETSPKPKSFDALPADAKEQCERFVNSIKGYTKEEYLANYDWDE